MDVFNIFNIFNLVQAYWTPPSVDVAGYDVTTSSWPYKPPTTPITIAVFYPPTFRLISTINLNRIVVMQRILRQASVAPMVARGAFRVPSTSCHRGLAHLTAPKDIPSVRYLINHELVQQTFWLDASRKMMSLFEFQSQQRTLRLTTSTRPQNTSRRPKTNLNNCTVIWQQLG